MRNITTGPHKSTEETRDAIVKLLCDELEKGLSIRVACDLVGIDRSTYDRWRRMAEKGDDEAIQLVRRLTAARAKGFELGVSKIKAAADDDWRAQAWLIDKLYPNHAGRGATMLEEIVLTMAEQGESLAKEYTAPERLRALAEIANELGLGQQPVRTAPQPPAPPTGQVQRAADALRGALAFGLRPVRETAQRIAEELDCDAKQVWDAADLLNLEQELSPGSRPMWKLPANPKRTRLNVEAPTTDESRTADPGVASGTSGSQGVGDFLRRRR